MSKKLFAKYYQENKEKLQKKAPERYQNLSKEENEKIKKKKKKKKKKKNKKDNKIIKKKKKKKKKKKYGCESYKNLPENEKNTLVEYRKKK